MDSSSRGKNIWSSMYSFDAFSQWAGWMQMCLYSLQLIFLGKGEGIGEQTRYWIIQSRASEYKKIYWAVLGDPNRIGSSSEAKNGRISYKPDASKEELTFTRDVPVEVGWLLHQEC